LWTKNNEEIEIPQHVFERTTRGCDFARGAYFDAIVLRHLGLFQLCALCFQISTFMRLGTVIGRVTLSASVPSLVGARWLLVSPFTREQFRNGSVGSGLLSREPSLVVYDDLGGSEGATIGFVEGREAACPFDEPPPIDAINAALVDEMFYSPFNQ
jgi:ethanolamine utilization protein EutN